MDRTDQARMRSGEARALRDYLRTRSPQALEALVVRYRPLARSLATRYRGAAEPLEDLFQVSELGLVKAIKGFDPSLGKPFTAYAVPTMLGEIKRHFRDRVWNLRLPRGLQESTAAVTSARDRVTERLGRDPSPREIAEELEVEVEVVLEALAAAEIRYTVPLEAPRGNDPDAPAAIDHFGSVDGGYDRVEADDAAAGAGLDERERTVLELRFEENLTQTEIGKRLGVSQMQISRISRKGLTKLLRAVRGDPPAGEPRALSVD